MMTDKIINIDSDNWQEVVMNLAFSNHLVCTGSLKDLQWFGTNLIQLLGQQSGTETSPIYGKLAVNFDDFCYQLCHSTPWGFEMGRNLNAVVDVLRGEMNSKNKFFIFYDAHYMYQDNFDNFKQLIRVFLHTAKERGTFNQNVRVIILMEESNKISVRRLLKHTENYPIETLQILYHEDTIL